MISILKGFAARISTNQRTRAAIALTLSIVSGYCLLYSHPPFEYWYLGTASLSATVLITRPLGARFLSFIVALSWAVYFVFLYLWIPGQLSSISILPLWLPIGLLIAIGLTAFTTIFVFLRLCIIVFGLTWGIILGILSFEVALSFWFPFGLVGYNIAKLPGAYRLASIGGVYLLSMVWLSLALAPFAVTKARKPLDLSLPIFAALTWFALMLPPSGIERKVSSLKIELANTQGQNLPNYDQSVKWAQTYSDQLKNGEGVAIGPETTMGLMDSGQQSLFEGAATVRNEMVLVGVVVNENGYRNASVLVSDMGVRQRYYKRRLVPFAEYIPFRETLSAIPGVEQLVVQLEKYHGDFIPGNELGEFLIYKARIQPSICWESAFPLHFANQQAGNLLLNQSNDTWFDPNQMHRMASYARLRAMEMNKYLVRVASYGVSAIFTPTGESISTSNFEVPLIEGNSVYGSYGRFFLHGWLIFWVLAIMFTIVRRAL